MKEPWIRLDPKGLIAIGVTAFLAAGSGNLNLFGTTLDFRPILATIGTAAFVLAFVQYIRDRIKKRDKRRTSHESRDSDDGNSSY